MNVHDNAVNKWEELIFDYFYDSLISKRSVSFVDASGNVLKDTEVGSIFPTTLTMSLVPATLKKWGFHSETYIPREFEKEVCARLATISEPLQKLLYLQILNKKFEEPVSRIPIYQQLLLELQSNFPKTPDYSDDQGPWVQQLKEIGILQHFMSDISSVHDIINDNFGQHWEAMLDNKKLAKAINSVPNSDKGIAANGGNEDMQKLKFICSPSVAGYILSELIEKGYLHAPKWKTDWNVRATAQILWNTFDFEKTTLKTFKQELSQNTNSLGDDKKQKLKLPRYEDL